MRTTTDESDLHERLRGATGLPIVHADDARKIAPFQNPVERDVAENELDLLMHVLQPDLVIRPGHDARAQLFGLHQPFRERDLVEADIK